MISCRNLSKRYGDFNGLEHLDLEVRPGEIYAMIGPNGAGKSTTVKLVAGLESPTSGSVTVLGSSPCEVRQSIGVMPGKPWTISKI